VSGSQSRGSDRLTGGLPRGSAAMSKVKLKGAAGSNSSFHEWVRFG
jgi:hypothetical protein